MAVAIPSLEDFDEHRCSRSCSAGPVLASLTPAQRDNISAGYDAGVPLNVMARTIERKYGGKRINGRILGRHLRGECACG